jgi:transposase InsO family protein
LHVDAHSKWSEVFKLGVVSTSTQQNTAILRQLFARFGLPKQFISDNGAQFAATEFKTFCEQRGILHCLVLAYHPRSNGQTERFIRTFKKGVRNGMEES